MIILKKKVKKNECCNRKRFRVDKLMKIKTKRGVNLFYKIKKPLISERFSTRIRQNIEPITL